MYKVLINISLSSGGKKVILDYNKVSSSPLKKSRLCLITSTGTRMFEMLGVLGTRILVPFSKQISCLLLLTYSNTTGNSVVLKQC